MTYFFIGGVVLLAVLAAFQGVRGLPHAARQKLMRWGAGGGAALIALLLVLIRRVDIAAFFGFAAFSILVRGRLGPFSFDSPDLHTDNTSRVSSRFFIMELDHDTGTVVGTVRSGQFARADLIDLDESQTRDLIDEVSVDADSVSLLESWLDANRAGWREYFAGQDGAAEPEQSPQSAEQEALDVLGLKADASEADIRSAHRELMKGVHPDHGGSSYLASKINEARDLLLKLRKKP